MSVIGISFGNSTTSIAAANQEGKVDVIANLDGERFITSCLSYIGNDEYHGNQALSQIIRHPQSTVTNFRDYIGLPFDKIDASVASATPINENGEVYYQINNQKISNDEIVKRHLKQIKDAAEDYLGKAIEGVVLTVPTNFTEEQKAKLVELASQIGLKVLQLINEPSAALLAHLTSNEDKLVNDKIYVVADFGGVRSDAAVIAVRGGIMTILSTLHDFKLGGDNLDAELSEHFAKEFEKKTKSNPRNNARSLAKMKQACIITKKTLSNVTSATISIDSLNDGYDFHSNVNRLRYELVAKKVFNKMTAFVEEVVSKAGLETLDIDEVLLCGGVSHTPKLASSIASLFPETTLVVSPATDTKLVDPNELIARGAALQASLVDTFTEEEIKESLQPVILNTQHLSKAIGIKDANGDFVEILPRETAYPIRKSTVLEGNGDVIVEVYEGERTVKETTIEAEKFSDDEDEEYSDEEPEIVREVVYKPGELLAQLAVKSAKDKVEVIIDINKEGKLTVTARSGATVVKGEVSA